MWTTLLLIALVLYVAIIGLPALIVRLWGSR
jgi:hypothetical protein